MVDIDMDVVDMYMVNMYMVNMDMVDMDNDNEDNDNDNDMPCLRSLSPMSRDHLADLFRTLGLVKITIDHCVTRAIV